MTIILYYDIDKESMLESDTHNIQNREKKFPDTTYQETYVVTADFVIV